MKYEKQVKKLTITYHFKISGISPVRFIEFKSPFNIFKEIRDGNKTLQETEKDQENLKSRLREITSGNPKYKEN